jgi:hypothetical protein
MNRKYEELIDKQFGHFTLVGITKCLLEGSKRKSTLLHFVCVCGVKKDFMAQKAGPIFSGSTTSCGCVGKTKWRKSYYAWKKDWTNKGLL